MGALCGHISRRQSPTKGKKRKIPVVSETCKVQSSDALGSAIQSHSPDQTLKNQVNKVIDKYIVSIPMAYQFERDRIVDEMKRAAPKPYLELFASDYPDTNRLIVNEMARRLVITNAVKQQLIEKVYERITSSFASQTTNKHSTYPEETRTDVKTLIEKLVSDAFDNLELE